MELLKRLSFQLLVLVQCIVNLVAKFVDKKEKRLAIPPIEDGLLNLSATRLAEKIRKFEITSQEVVSAYIKRIKIVNPIINAVVQDRFSEALNEARLVDESLRGSSNPDLARRKPLLGVPITIKESIAVEGMSFTGCSLTRAGIQSEADSKAVALLKEAGAIVLLVSSTPEYCTAIETNNKVVGRAKNPYDTRRVCGGSSGGEGALLGAGASVLGLGSDIGGSIRIPCAFNGIYGHKPTAGVVSLEGTFPWCKDKRFVEYLVVGPMARYVEDLKLAMKILSGPSKSSFDRKIDLKQVKIFYMVDSYSDFGLEKVDKALQGAIKDGVSHLRRAHGCTVDETKFHEMGSAFEMVGLIFRMEGSPDVFRDSPVKYSALKEFGKFLLGRSIFSFQSFIFTVLTRTGFLMTDKEFQNYLGDLEEFKKKFSKTLGEDGVLLYPSFPTAAFKHNGFIAATQGCRFPAIVNLLGCPATCVPIGLNKEGLPLGIQVIGTPNSDHLTLEVAKELGEYYGGWRGPI